jgi:hypothetical protein
MPADDGLHGIPAEDLAGFLHDLRALRVREGLGLDGAAGQPELPPGSGPAAGQPGFTITRLGHTQVGPPRRWWRPSPALTRVMAAALALAALAAGGVLLTRPAAGHHDASAPGAPRPAGGRSMTDHGGRMRMRVVVPARPSPQPTTASPVPARGTRKAHARVRVPALLQQGSARLEVAGVGCPDNQGDGVSLDAASTGPAWTAAAGGWAGNGCNGSSVWAMDPNGNQPSPSTLTWFFHPSARETACRLDVFVPTRNALGMASYEISEGAVNLGTVSVDQAASAGRWVALGSYPVTGGMLDIQLLPGTATLTAATSGNGGNGNSGNGGNGNGKGGNGKASGGGKGGSGGQGPGGTGPGNTAPTPSPAPGHNAAVAASAARATCG